MHAKNKRRDLCSTTLARESRFILIFVKDKWTYFEPRIFVGFTNFIWRVTLFGFVDARGTTNNE